MLKSHFYTGKREAGCDEAGRGCLAGSVYAAAVIFPEDYHNDELNDSKQLTDRRRHALRPIIERDALAWAVGIVSPEEIDQINSFVQEVGDDIEVQWGASIDESLGEDVRVTVIATGYKVDGLPSEDAEDGKKTIDEAINENYPPQVPNPMEDEHPQLIDLSDTLREEGVEIPTNPVKERAASTSADDVVITIDGSRCPPVRWCGGVQIEWNMDIGTVRIPQRYLSNG